MELPGRPTPDRPDAGHSRAFLVGVGLGVVLTAASVPLWISTPPEVYRQWDKIVRFALYKMKGGSPDA